MLIVVAKAPARGQTKTRLGQLIGLDAAADFYKCLLADVLDIAREAAAQTPALTLAIGYWPAGSEHTFRDIAPDFKLLLQAGDTLGERLNHVLGCAFAEGYAQVAVMSSDTPFVAPAALARGFAALTDGADVALGPCDDGGYYVLHVRAPRPELLLPIQMSTPFVVRDTLAAAQRANLRVEMLPATTDIDTPDDLQRLLNAREWPAHAAERTRTWLNQWQTQHSS